MFPRHVVGARPRCLEFVFRFIQDSDANLVVTLAKRVLPNDVGPVIGLGDRTLRSSFTSTDPKPMDCQQTLQIVVLRQAAVLFAGHGLEAVEALRVTRLDFCPIRKLGYEFDLFVLN